MTGSGDYIKTISSSRLAEDQLIDSVRVSHIMSIEIPQEVVVEFASNGGGGSVRTVSFLFNNVDDIFPGDLPGGGNK